MIRPLWEYSRLRHRDRWPPFRGAQDDLAPSTAAGGVFATTAKECPWCPFCFLVRCGKSRKWYRFVGICSGMVGTGRYMYVRLLCWVIVASSSSTLFLPTGRTERGWDENRHYTQMRVSRRKMPWQSAQATVRWAAVFSDNTLAVCTSPAPSVRLGNTTLRALLFFEHDAYPCDAPAVDQSV